MKVTSLNKVIDFSTNSKNNNKTVGLVVGSFDILHVGHLNLFRLAKRYVDVLIVGLDHDETIKATKGSNRPVNNFKRRSEFLNDLHTVDKIFLIENISTHGSEESLETYTDLLENIKPTHIFTHEICDRHWKNKNNLAKKHKIVCVTDKSDKITTSGEIIQKLMLDF